VHYRTKLGLGMHTGADIENYLAKAKEAEEQAARTSDHHMRQSWQRIAASYREMAQQRLDRMGAPPTSKQLSQLPAAKAGPQDDV